MNRNVLRRDAGKIDSEQAGKLDRVWGDDSWRNVAYAPVPQLSLFAGEESVENQENDAIARAFRDRLRDVAGFTHVVDPIPMKISTGATLYYLFFAAHRPVAQDIVQDIFDRYRE